MKRDYKTLRLQFDGTVYQSRLAPTDVDSWDGTCPACGGSRYYEVCTVVQSGFIQDSCTTLCHCATCHETFHYNYCVEAAIADNVELNDNREER